MPKIQPPPQDSPTPPPQPEPSTVNVFIVRSGDVVLSVKGNTKLFVSSKVLAVSSPFFEAMFKPEWFDSKKSSKGDDELPEIDFSDHEADVMITLCNLLHFRNTTVTKPNTWEKLTQLAILADQYCCVNAINFALTIWMKELANAGKDANSANPAGKKLFSEFCHTAVSYIFRDETEFKLATSKLIINHAGTYRDFGEYLGFEVLPWVFPVILEEQRTHVRNTLFSKLWRYMQPLFTCHQGSVHDGRTSMAFRNVGEGPHMTLMRLLIEWEEHPISLAEMKIQLNVENRFPSMILGTPLTGNTMVYLAFAADVHKMAKTNVGVASGLLVSEVRAAAGVGDDGTVTEDEILNAALEQASLDEV